MKYYVYELIDPRTDNVFYVGKGCGTRCYWHIRQRSKNKPTENSDKDKIITCILEAGFEVNVRKVFFTDDESLAYRTEEQTIRQYGLENLTNRRYPSDTPGYTRVVSPARKEQMRAAMIGHKINNGRKWSEEHKAKIGKALKESYLSGKRVYSEKSRAATSKAHKGKVLSDETKQKLGAGRRGKTYEEIHGVEKATELKALISKNSTSRINGDKIRGKTYEQLYGIERASKMRARISAGSMDKRQGIKILIDKTVYPSLQSASRATGISPYLIRKNYIETR
jgi:hypothetical protein